MYARARKLKRLLRSGGASGRRDGVPRLSSAVNHTVNVRTGHTARGPDDRRSCAATAFRALFEAPLNLRQTARKPSAVLRSKASTAFYALPDESHFESNDLPLLSDLKQRSSILSRPIAGEIRPLFVILIRRLISSLPSGYPKRASFGFVSRYWRYKGGGWEG